ncbi:glycoside hydrolase family 32 protein [Pinirhizobacter sp.]|jgi:beta-fructofuranosidase|uniref:glycoside hydrolase family 32 protein n=1 Tax=Pinirhizobacter sp. TaxID=2950432 RepID=UPI002F3F02E7
MASAGNFSARRRNFISLSILAALAAPLARANGFIPGTAPARDLARDPMRPTFHFLPKAGWINDPNGPIFHNGMYHLFYQYNAALKITGGMSWGHATSRDMVHWRHEALAMAPVPDSPDSFGVWTGSCLAVDKRVYAVYTGVAKSDVAHASVHGDQELHETQMISWSDDAGLDHWKRPARTIVADPPPGMKVTGFRDPSLWRQGGYFYMTVGSGEAHKGGCVLLYRSRDLATFEYQHRLVGADWNGAPADDGGDMWECPEFFPLGDGHVLIYSTEGRAHWLSGKLDTDTMVFHPAKQGVLDTGAFYAPKTQLDAQGERILWGWVQETRSSDAFEAAGWAGMISLPRRLRLDTDGRLRMDIPAVTKQLRAGSLAGKRSGEHAVFILPGSNGEVVCAGVKDAPFEVIVTAASEELLRIAFAPDEHEFSAASRRIPLSVGDEPSVHLFVDGSVIEAVIGKREGYTTRFYIKNAPDITVEVRGEGVRAQAWSVSATPT